SLLVARLLRARRPSSAPAPPGTLKFWPCAFFAVFALGTGLAATIHLQAGPEAHQAITLHMKWAVSATLALVLLAVWRGAGAALESRPSWIFIVLLMAATAALIMTGYRGGQNVYRYGVGVHGIPCSR